VTATVSLSVSAGELDPGEAGAPAEALASALVEEALLEGAAAVASSSAEQPLTRPIPAARTSVAARRAERAEPVGWDPGDLPGVTVAPPRRRLLVAPDAPTVKDLGGTP
jgi:hypothetical protein